MIPVAYVDRTDAYRIRDRSPRVAIALAGMVNDGWIMGCTALVALNSSDFIYQVSTVLLGYQFLLLLANLNPFAPSDTVSALEAAMGAVDIRGRSHVLLYSKIFRTETPVYVRNISKRQRKFYILYAVLSYVFAAVVICAFIYNLILVPSATGFIPGITIEPMWAAAAMALSSVTVVLNALRLKRIKLN